MRGGSADSPQDHRFRSKILIRVAISRACPQFPPSVGQVWRAVSESAEAVMASRSTRGFDFPGAESTGPRAHRRFRWVTSLRVV